MKVICDHAGTEHCKEVKKIYHGCWDSKPHDINSCYIFLNNMKYFTCRANSGNSIKVKCIPYQEGRK